MINRFKSVGLKLGAWRNSALSGIFDPSSGKTEQMCRLEWKHLQKHGSAVVCPWRAEPWCVQWTFTHCSFADCRSFVIISEIMLAPNKMLQCRFIREKHYLSLFLCPVFTLFFINVKNFFFISTYLGFRADLRDHSWNSLTILRETVLRHTSVVLRSKLESMKRWIWWYDYLKRLSFLLEPPFSFDQNKSHQLDTWQ